MKFVVITGPDASGKDTQIEKLSEQLKSRGFKVQTLSIQNSLSDFAEIADMKTINAFLQIFLLKFEPTARTHFLISLLRNAVARIDTSADFVLCNGYWYKYAASEEAYGIRPEYWFMNIETLPRPDLVIELNASFENCLLRRSQWSPYESGQAKPTSDLHTFQKSMRQSLAQMMNRLDVRKIVINGDQSENVVAEELLAKVMPLFNRP